jgi:hypothetical protein
VDHSLALRSDGTVVAWGYNFDGQCNVPPGLGGVTRIAAGEFFSLALKSDGTVVAWGANDYGQCDVPIGLNGVVAISAGHAHCLALLGNGTVVAWGSDAFGQSDIPAGLSGVTSIVAAWNYSLARKGDGTVVAWGVNDAGQTAVPGGLSNVEAISGNQTYSLALKGDATIVMWGSGPAVPAGLSGVKAIAAGETHGLAIKSDGSVVAWGVNRSGETVVPGGLGGVTAISAGWHYSMALAGGIASTPDLIPPTVSVTEGPPLEARLTNSIVQLGGQSSDNVGVTLVEWQLRNSSGAGAWQPATGTVNWSATVSGLTAGLNTVSVRSRDLAGNLSAEVSRSFELLVPLTITINGCGSLEPDLTGTTFQEAGSSLAVTASPCPGFAFMNWTGGIVFNTSALSFVVQPGLVLQANFAAAPFVPIKATFFGLFTVPDTVAQGSSGSFTVSTTVKRTFTGNLQSGNNRYPISGQFDTNGSATITIHRRNLNSLLVNLQIDLSPGADRITGSVSDGTFTAELRGNSAAFDGRTALAPQAGKYTVAILGSPASAAAPGGDGVGVVQVDRAGRIRLTGTLADGTKISQSASLSKDGQWPLYVPLYGGQGSVLSWITFADLPEEDLTGDLVWIKPATSKKLFPAGFALATIATGSRYQQPARGTPILNLSPGSIELTGANLAQGITNRISLGTGNRVTNLSSNKLSLTFSTTAGSFKGSIVNPASGKSISFNGVVLQKPNVGRGFFLDRTQSGEVLMGR